MNETGDSCRLGSRQAQPVSALEGRMSSPALARPAWPGCGEPVESTIQREFFKKSCLAGSSFSEGWIEGEKARMTKLSAYREGESKIEHKTGASRVEKVWIDWGEDR